MTDLNNLVSEFVSQRMTFLQMVRGRLEAAGTAWIVYKVFPTAVAS